MSYDVWERRFGGDPGIVGRALAINGEVLTVIGVAAKGFSGTELGRRSQLFVPLTMRWRLDLNPLDSRSSLENRDFTWLRLFGRLRAGVSVEQATAGINAVHGGIVREPEAPSRGLTRNALPRSRLELQPGSRGQGSIPAAAESLTLLLGLTVLVLLLVCVNVMNLLLVRGAARAGEMAIRESMGASRKRLVASVDATLPITNVTTLRRQAQDNIFVDRVVTILSTGFAGLATLLTAIGLYSVMAYNSVQRTRELGLRLALGAKPTDLRSMLLKQAGWMLSIGIVIGLAGAIGSRRALDALLYGLSSWDPAVLGASAAILAVVVLAASYWPARRASRIAPMEALRHE